MKRSKYTWDVAVKDLALSSALTIREAHDVTWELRSTDLHPYDAVPHLIHLFGPIRTMNASRPYEQRGEALARLVEMTSAVSDQGGEIGGETGG